MSKSKKLTAILAATLAVVVCGVATFSGCLVGADGKDGVGVDGKDLTLTEVYEAYLNEIGKTKDEYTLQQFIEERYGGYTNSELEAQTSFTYKKTQTSISGWKPSVSEVSYTNYYAGSGVITEIDTDNSCAYVVTNCHVVYDIDAVGQTISTDVRLYLYGQDQRDVNFTVSYDQSKYSTYGVQDQSISGDDNYVIKATVVGASIAYDIALLKITGDDYTRLVSNDVTAAGWSSSDDVTMGETVYAVGNPEGYGMSVTQGIVSRDSEIIPLDITDKGTSYRNYRVIRTDTAINGGNSGGGLFNAQGQLVGIVNAKDEQSDIENIGYALPASTVKRVVALMKAKQNGAISSPSLQRAYCGINTEVTDSKSQLIEENGEAKMVITQTVSVKSVSSDALVAGSIKTGDIIRSIAINDGEAKTVTRDYHVIDKMLEVKNVGDVVKLVILRDGKEMTLEFTVRSSDFANADS